MERKPETARSQQMQRRRLLRSPMWSVRDAGRRTETPCTGTRHARVHYRRFCVRLCARDDARVCTYEGEVFILWRPALTLARVRLPAVICVPPHPPICAPHPQRTELGHWWRQARPPPRRRLSRLQSPVVNGKLPGTPTKLPKCARALRWMPCALSARPTDSRTTTRCLTQDAPRLLSTWW